MLLDANILTNVLIALLLICVHHYYVNPISVTVTKSLGTPSLRLPYLFETGQLAEVPSEYSLHTCPLLTPLLYLLIYTIVGRRQARLVVVYKVQFWVAHFYRRLPLEPELKSYRPRCLPRRPQKRHSLANGSKMRQQILTSRLLQSSRSQMASETWVLEHS